MADLAAVANQLEATLERMLQATNKFLTQFENELYKEEFDANRLVLLEEIGQTVANGSISLTSRVGQAFLIEGIIISIDANTPAILTLDRYSQNVKNTQSTTNIIAPVKYLSGPGKVIKLSWTTAPTTTPYFAIYGKLVGSLYG